MMKLRKSLQWISSKILQSSATFTEQLKLTCAVCVCVCGRQLLYISAFMAFTVGLLENQVKGLLLDPESVSVCVCVCN